MCFSLSWIISIIKWGAQRMIYRRIFTWKEFTLEELDAFWEEAKR